MTNMTGPPSLVSHPCDLRLSREPLIVAGRAYQMKPGGSTFDAPGHKSAKSGSFESR